MFISFEESFLLPYVLWTFSKWKTFPPTERESLAAAAAAPSSFKTRWKASFTERKTMKTLSTNGFASFKLIFSRRVFHSIPSREKFFFNFETKVSRILFLMYLLSGLVLCQDFALNGKHSNCGYKTIANRNVITITIQIANQQFSWCHSNLSHRKLVDCFRMKRNTKSVCIWQANISFYMKNWSI